MRISLAALVLMLASLPGQAQVPAGGALTGNFPRPHLAPVQTDVLTFQGNLTFTGSLDASASLNTKPIQIGSVLPPTPCSPWSWFILTTGVPGQNLYECTLSGTWLEVLGIGGGNGNVPFGGTAAQVLRGDLTWLTLNSDAVPEGTTNLYFSQARAIAALSGLYQAPILGAPSTWPTLATVSSTGSYNDLLNKPTIPAGQVNADWNAVSGLAAIANKPTVPGNTSQLPESGNLYFTNARAVAAMSGLYQTPISNAPGVWPSFAAVAISGAYSSLSGLPTIPAAQINADWNASSGLSQILNKPTIPTTTSQISEGTNQYFTPARVVSAMAGLYQSPISGAPGTWPGFAAVATSGSYVDLSNKPTIPAAQVNSDWSAVSGLAQILNKPTIPTNTSQITENGNLYFTPARVLSAMSGLYQAPITGAPGTWPGFAAVATSGSYADLSNKPTLVTLGGFANPMSAAGDFIVGGAGGVPQRLAAPANGTYCPNWSTGVVTWIACPGSGGGISSITMTVPSGFGIAGSPLTANGTLAISLASQSGSYALIAPTAGGVPTWRALVPADIPMLNQSTSGNAATVTNGLYSNGTYNDPLWLTLTWAGGRITGIPSFAAVATTGAYSSLSGLPTIPAAQVNSDWNAISGLAQILNKPTIPSNTSQITESGNLYFTNARVLTAMSGLYQAPISGAPGTWPSFAAVATSGSYADLSSKPTLISLGGFADPMTTIGDFIVAGASGVPQRLAAPTNGTYCPNWATGVVTWTSCPAGISSITFTVPSGFSASGSPLTANGTLGFSLASQGNSYVLIAPTAGGVPTWRALALTDIPTTLTGITLDSVTPTTFGYLDATSSIQTQLNGKQNTISGAPGTWPTLGTAAAQNTGTSGATLGLLNGTLTFSGANNYGTPASINLANATFPTLNQSTSGNAATATSIAAGAVGAIPYQSAASTTVFLPGNVAATDQVMVSHGTGAAAQAPTLSNAPALSITSMTGTLPAALEPAHTGDMHNTAGSLVTVVAAINGVTVSGSATAGKILNATSGIAAAWTATQTLGASGTLGSLTMGNATSGLLTLQPVTGALGTVTMSIPVPVGGSTLTQTIANVQLALPTVAVAGNACSASATTATATGAATTDTTAITYASDPTAVTGYGAGTNGGITIRPWITANTINVKLCNETGTSITPGPLTINLRVTR